MHIKTKLISTAAFVMGASSATAGGYVAPVIPYEPMVAAPQSVPFDWTGPYVGLSAGHSKIKLNRSLIEEEPIVVEHPAETETVTIEHPAETEEVTIPAVTETVEHPAVTETIEHPGGVEVVTIPAVTKDVDHPAETETVEHPAVTETVEHPAETRDEIEYGKLWTGDGSTIPEKHRGVCQGDSKCPIPVEGTGSWTSNGWTGEWAQGEVGRTTVVTKPAWTETVTVKDAWTETVTVKDAWTETVIVTPERTESKITEPWTETVTVKDAWTETVVVEPERTETVVTRPAWTETKEVVVKDAWTEVVGTAYTATVLDLKDNTNTFGAFAGYRYQWSNRVVAGVEANYTKTNGVEASYGAENYRFDLDTVSIEAQAGYAMGRLLPYVAVGYASTGGDGGWMAAVGADYAITDRLIIGAKYTHYEYDDLKSWDADLDNVSLRLGLKF